MRRTWMIGEAPAQSMDGQPAFSSQTGRRMSAWLDQDVREVFTCRNLLHEWPGRGTSGKGSMFPHEDGRVAARNMLQELAEIHRTEDQVDEGPIRVILVGLRVARAFMVKPPIKPLTWDTWTRGCSWAKAQVPPGGEFAVLPHPSGVNRWYNEEENEIAAVRFLQAEMLRSMRKNVK